jgi:hypothetical protein
MAKKAKVNRVIKQSNNVQNPTDQPVLQTNINKQPKALNIYESQKYLKNDLKWSGITAGIVVIVLIIIYIFLH